MDNKQISQMIYDRIFDALTMGPAGVGGGVNLRASLRTSSYLTLLNPGDPVDVSQFTNEWSPSNPKGTLLATENFADYTDHIPNLQPMHSDTGLSLEGIFGEEVVRANVAPQPDDPKKKAAYDAAYGVLHTDGTDYDAAGTPITVKVDSAAYIDYKNKLKAYDDAVTSYMNTYLLYDLTKIEDQRAWALLAPRLQGPVISAWNDLQLTSPGRIEAAINTVGQDSQSSIATRFTNARFVFDNTKRGSLTRPGVNFHWCEAYPGNWFGSADGFSELVMSSSKLYHSEDSHFSKWHAGADFNFGLFSIAGSGGSRATRQNTASDTTDVEIKLKLGRVEIRRRWFDPGLFSLQGWSVAGRRKNAYSSGKADGTNDGIFTLFPTSFIVARDIEIKASWGRSDKELITHHSGAGGGLSFGPFTIGGRGSSSSFTGRFHSEFDGNTIKIPGAQVIAWMNQLVPASPPVDG